MSKIKNYLSLVKFAHTIFAMPFAMIGFCLGALNVTHTSGSNPNYLQYGIKFILVLVCMVTARTAIREIPKGIISANSALRFVILNCVIFVVATWFINTICFILSPVALFVILFYSFTKRFTALCHLVLGLGLSLAPIGAFLAVTGVFALVPVLFSLSVIFWVSGFDIIYALQDEEFDKTNDLYSIPSRLGKVKALKVSSLLHFISAACVIAAGYYGNFHWIYWIGIGVFVLMLIYQHSLVKPTDLSKVNIAFMTANGIASVVFAVLVIADLLLF